MKRARALKKTEAERAVCREKDAEIARLKAEISELTQTAQNQKKMIERYAVFDKFMADVLESSDEVSQLQMNLSLSYTHSIPPSYLIVW